MIRLFLKAKHWQLFFLMVGVPIIGYIFFVIQLINTFEMQSSTSGTMTTPAGVIDMMRPILFFVMIPILVQIGWYYSLGKGVQRFINPALKMKTTVFTLSNLLPLIFFVGMIILFNRFLGNLVLNPNYVPPTSYMSPLVLFVLVPLNIILTVCMVDNDYVIARTIKTAELNRVVRFSDYAGEFFSMWFHFIGVWIVQPKVNQLQEYVPGDIVNELHD